MERPLQPPHRAEREPMDEDAAYDEARQREVDEESAAEARMKLLEDLLTAAVSMARIAPDDIAKDAVRFVYLQGRIDALLAK